MAAATVGEVLFSVVFSIPLVVGCTARVAVMRKKKEPSQIVTKIIKCTTESKKIFVLHDMTVISSHHENSPITFRPLFKSVYIIFQSIHFFSSLYILKWKGS